MRSEDNFTGVWLNSHLIQFGMWAGIIYLDFLENEERAAVIVNADRYYAKHRE